ncbi:MAG: hypothetical protein HGA47_02065 [Zoogloea sp.]|nr:hypothetical protein [Zoogloea sp.]
MKALLILAGLCSAWGAALWWLIVPDFSRWSQPALLAGHALPPLGVWAGGWLFLRHLRQKSAEREAAAGKLAEEARRAAQEAERERHEAALAERQYGCDCRAVAMIRLRQPGAMAPDDAGAAAGVASRILTDVPQDEPHEGLAHALAASLYEAALAVYSNCAAAVRFPVYVVPPAHAAGEEVFAVVREMFSRAADELGLSTAALVRSGAVLYLPGADCAANSVVTLFERSPELPGALVVAFDSPLLETDQASIDDFDPEERERLKWRGRPGHGVFALLLTHPSLSASLAQRPQDAPAAEVDAMTPFWQKDRHPDEALALIESLSQGERDVLIETPVLARIHRAVVGRLEKTGGARALTRAIAPRLREAAENAGLVDVPFRAEGGEAEAPAAQEFACGWLVHNAGSIDCAGQRLGSLGQALLEVGSELDLIQAGTNVVVEAGDLGEARSVALVALAVARAAEQDAPALYAEFSGDAGLSLGFVALAQADA